MDELSVHSGAGGSGAEREIGARGVGAGGLALELTGGMPCVRCRYDLRGLTVRGMCPECGTAIRATILARVDPLAKELQAVHTPRLTAGLLVLWASGALGAAVVSWVPRVVEALNRLEFRLEPPGWVAGMVVACVAASGVGALGLVRPQRGIPAWQSWAALVAALLYVPYALVTWQVVGVLDVRDPSPYLGVGGVDAARATWRVAMDLLLLGMLMGLRFNARHLAARSFVLRTGRVDRQTMLAMAAAVGVVLVGDVLAVVAAGAGTSGTRGAMADLMRMGTLLLVGVGSLLVTLGLAGVWLDVMRLVPVVASPPLAIEDVTRVSGAGERERAGDGAGVTEGAP